jgi:serine/threonine protein kinase
LGAEEAAAQEEPVVEILSPVDDSVKPERTDPQRIGRYELCFELASGGMASVYLARIDGVSGFEKLVALKRIHRHLAKEKGYVDMFLDEARIASRITHPNVCSVFDFGEADGEHYIAMEYLVGEPLSRLMSRAATDHNQRRSPLLPLRMARIIADACEGLHAAHELKDANGDLLHVVHRDVSPRNLFVTYDGAVQVVDFGIASASQRQHHTSTGQVKGTFAYMAPEQLAGQPIDRRVDIWSLGVALWEMLAVKRLFKRDTTANTIHSVLYDEIQPPSDYRSQVPEELDRIVLKALERDPKVRWRSAREMGQALRQFLGTQKEIMGPAELSEWMEEVFPQGEARKSQLMEIARMAGTSLPSMPQANDTDATLTATDVRLSTATLSSWLQRCWAPWRLSRRSRSRSASRRRPKLSRWPTTLLRCKPRQWWRRSERRPASRPQRRLLRRALRNPGSRRCRRLRSAPGQSNAPRRSPARSTSSRGAAGPRSTRARSHLGVPRAD